MEQLTQQGTALFNDPVHAFFVSICGIGGYLLIRFILERMPDKKDENKGWINNINDTE
jgi:hypothetical protein